MTLRPVLFFLLAAWQPMLFAAGVSSDVSRLVGPPRGAVLQGEALEKKTAELARLLRCPVCQGLSISDSPSPMARNMRVQVRDLLAAGYDQEQILSYFESSYGEFVRLQPPLRGVNWLVWLAPVAGLGIGCLLVAATISRLRKRGVSSPERDPGSLSAEEQARLAPYLLTVRSLVSESDDSPKARRTSECSATGIPNVAGHSDVRQPSLAETPTTSEEREKRMQ